MEKYLPFRVVSLQWIDFQVVGCVTLSRDNVSSW